MSGEKSSNTCLDTNGKVIMDKSVAKVKTLKKEQCSPKRLLFSPLKTKKTTLYGNGTTTAMSPGMDSQLNRYEKLVKAALSGRNHGPGITSKMKTKRQSKGRKSLNKSQAYQSVRKDIEELMFPSSSITQNGTASNYLNKNLTSSSVLSHHTENNTHTTIQQKIVETTKRNETGHTIHKNDNDTNGKATNLETAQTDKKVDQPGRVSPAKLQNQIISNEKKLEAVPSAHYVVESGNFTDVKPGTYKLVASNKSSDSSPSSKSWILESVNSNQNSKKGKTYYPLSSLNQSPDKRNAITIPHFNDAAENKNRNKTVLTSLCQSPVTDNRIGLKSLIQPPDKGNLKLSTGIQTTSGNSGHSTSVDIPSTSATLNPIQESNVSLTTQQFTTDGRTHQNWISSQFQNLSGQNKTGNIYQTNNFAVSYSGQNSPASKASINAAYHNLPVKIMPKVSSCHAVASPVKFNAPVAIVNTPEGPKALPLMTDYVNGPYLPNQYGMAASNYQLGGYGSQISPCIGIGNPQGFSWKNGNYSVNPSYNANPVQIGHIGNSSVVFSTLSPQKTVSTIAQPYRIPLQVPQGLPMAMSENVSGSCPSTPTKVDNYPQRKIPMSKYEQKIQLLKQSEQFDTPGKEIKDTTQAIAIAIKTKQDPLQTCLHNDSNIVDVNAQQIFNKNKESTSLASTTLRSELEASSNKPSTQPSTKEMVNGLKQYIMMKKKSKEVSEGDDSTGRQRQDNIIKQQLNKDTTNSASLQNKATNKSQSASDVTAQTKKNLKSASMEAVNVNTSTPNSRNGSGGKPRKKRKRRRKISNKSHIANLLQSEKIIQESDKAEDMTKQVPNTENNSEQVSPQPSESNLSSRRYSSPMSLDENAISELLKADTGYELELCGTDSDCTLPYGNVSETDIFEETVNATNGRNLKNDFNFEPIDNAEKGFSKLHFQGTTESAAASATSLASEQNGSSTKLQSKQTINFPISSDSASLESIRSCKNSRGNMDLTAENISHIPSTASSSESCRFNVIKHQTAESLLQAEINQANTGDLGPNIGSFQYMSIVDETGAVSSSLLRHESLGDVEQHVANVIELNISDHSSDIADNVLPVVKIENLEDDANYGKKSESESRSPSISSVIDICARCLLDLTTDSKPNSSLEILNEKVSQIKEVEDICSPVLEAFALTSACTLLANVAQDKFAEASSSNSQHLQNGTISSICQILSQQAMMASELTFNLAKEVLTKHTQGNPTQLHTEESIGSEKHKDTEINKTTPSTSVGNLDINIKFEPIDTGYNIQDINKRQVVHQDNQPKKQVLINNSCESLIKDTTEQVEVLSCASKDSQCLTTNQEQSLTICPTSIKTEIQNDINNLDKICREENISNLNNPDKKSSIANHVFVANPETPNMTKDVSDTSLSVANQPADQDFHNPSSCDIRSIPSSISLMSIESIQEIGSKCNLFVETEEPNESINKESRRSKQVLNETNSVIHKLKVSNEKEAESDDSMKGVSCQDITSSRSKVKLIVDKLRNTFSIKQKPKNASSSSEIQGTETELGASLTPIRKSPAPKHHSSHSGKSHKQQSGACSKRAINDISEETLTQSPSKYRKLPEGKIPGCDLPRHHSTTRTSSSKAARSKSPHQLSPRAENNKVIPSKSPTARKSLDFTPHSNEQSDMKNKLSKDKSSHSSHSHSKSSHRKHKRTDRDHNDMHVSSKYHSHCGRQDMLHTPKVKHSSTKHGHSNGHHHHSIRSKSSVEYFKSISSLNAENKKDSSLKGLCKTTIGPGIRKELVKDLQKVSSKEKININTATSKKISPSTKLSTPSSVTNKNSDSTHTTSKADKHIVTIKTFMPTLQLSRVDDVKIVKHVNHSKKLTKTPITQKTTEKNASKHDKGKTVYASPGVKLHNSTPGNDAPKREKSISDLRKKQQEKLKTVSQWSVKSSVGQIDDLLTPILTPSEMLSIEVELAETSNDIIVTDKARPKEDSARPKKDKSIHKMKVSNKTSESISKDHKKNSSGHSSMDFSRNAIPTALHTSPSIENNYKSISDSSSSDDNDENITSLVNNLSEYKLPFSIF